MSRVCELTGKGRQVGNNVSHANNKTKRTFLPNLQNVTLMSEALEKSVKLRVSTHGLRSVEHVGGLDNWLVKTSEDKLSPRAAKLKRELAKKAKAAAAKALPTADPARASMRRGLIVSVSRRQVERDQQGPHPRPEIIVADHPQPRSAIGQGRGRDPFEIVERRRASSAMRRAGSPAPAAIRSSIGEPAPASAAAPAAPAARRAAAPHPTSTPAPTIAPARRRARRRFGQHQHAPSPAATSASPPRLCRPVARRAAARSSARSKPRSKSHSEWRCSNADPPAAPAGSASSDSLSRVDLRSGVPGPVGQVVKRERDRRRARRRREAHHHPRIGQRDQARPDRSPAPTVRRSAGRARVSRHARKPRGPPRRRARLPVDHAIGARRPAVRLARAATTCKRKDRQRPSASC